MPKLTDNFMKIVGKTDFQILHQNQIPEVSKYSLAISEDLHSGYTIGQLLLTLTGQLQNNCPLFIL